jgi:hypothetical protein
MHAHWVHWVPEDFKVKASAIQCHQSLLYDAAWQLGVPLRLPPSCLKQGMSVTGPMRSSTNRTSDIRQAGARNILQCQKRVL